MGGRMGGGRRGGRMGGGRRGGAMGGARGGARPARRPAAASRASRPSGGAMGGRRASAGGRRGARRMAQAPRTPQQRRRERRRERRQDRRDARKARRMAQAGTPGDSTQQPGSSTSGDEGWFDGGGGFGLSSLFPQSNEPEDYTSQEFDTGSLFEPYQKYADEQEEGWITGLMRSGQKGYDLPKEVTVASAMNSPFRYYGGY